MAYHKFQSIGVLAILFGVGFGFTSGNAQGGWLKDRLEDVKKIPNSIPHVPNPIQPQIDIITGTPPKQAFSDFVKNNGNTIVTVVDKARTVSNTAEMPLSNAVQAVGGKYGTIAYEILSGTQRYQREFVFSAADGAANILQGQDPLAALALPLAAAIRDARSKFYNESKPLPDKLIQLLAPVLPMPLLHRARYAKGELKIALPYIINSEKKMFENEPTHAVTVDDIIVFSNVPGCETESDVVWWAHELHHVHQFSQWGVDQFAFNYLKHSGRVESEANHAEEFVRSYLEKLPTGNVLQPEASFSKIHWYEKKQIETPLGVTEVFVETQQAMSGFQATDRCIIKGDDVVILKDKSIISITQGGITVGSQISPPTDPLCSFDLLSHKSGRRYCVAPPTGYVLARDPLTPLTNTIIGSGIVVGRCAKCGIGVSCP